MNCGICRRPLRSDNRSGRCVRCQAARRSLTRCACGCGRPIDVRARGVFSKVCAMRLAYSLGNRLAALAREGDPRAAPLLVAIRELADRPWSEIRLNRLHEAAAAFGALPPLAAPTFLGGAEATP